MSYPNRCRRCGALFVADRFAGFPCWWRLCPRCRGSLPPTGRVPIPDRGKRFPCPAEAA